MMGMNMTSTMGSNMDDLSVDQLSMDMKKFLRHAGEDQGKEFAEREWCELNIVREFKRIRIKCMLNASLESTLASESHLFRRITYK